MRREFAGIAASAGIAIGPLVYLGPAAVRTIARVADDPATEWRRLDTAIRGAAEESRQLAEWAKVRAGENEAGIFDAQSLFLEDPEWIDRASHLVQDEHRDAESAWQSAAEEYGARLSSLDDPYLRARATDVADVAARVQRRLGGVQAGSMILRERRR